MSGYAVKRIDEMEAVYLGAFKRARAELGVESFGMAIIDLPPTSSTTPSTTIPETGRRRFSWPCAAPARSRSRASASRSTPTMSSGSRPGRSGRSGPAPTGSACSRSAGSRGGSTSRPPTPSSANPIRRRASRSYPRGSRGLGTRGPAPADSAGRCGRCANGGRARRPSPWCWRRAAGGRSCRRGPGAALALSRRERGARQRQLDGGAGGRGQQLLE